MKFNLFLFTFQFTTALFSQESIKTKKTDSLNLDFDVVYAYNSDAIYYKKSTSLFKSTKQKEFEYNNFSLGKIEMVNTYNPLQTLLFYRNFNTIVLLDNQLSETYKLNGNHLEQPINFEAVGQAGQNQIWFFDSFSQKIGLYHFNTNTIKFISTPLLSNRIKYYQSNYNYFYWVDNNNDINKISVFGKISFLDRASDFDFIQLTDKENYIYKKENKLYYKDIVSELTYEIIISQNSFDNFYYKNGILSIFTTDKVINYKIQLP
ncbi:MULTISPECIES: hypothetical protein [Flavobacterium]|uniref:Uncharacterized protein n=1 Tax=Flavobacterium jumunjinense TaxID=998845 RepID=A0ABV5GL58_9FLAO|nr:MULTISPECIES: hypothetical protein [Flavobacterium]